MSISYYTYGPNALVISGISNLIHLGYAIDCQPCATRPPQGIFIYNIIELIRLIRTGYSPNSGEKIILLIVE